jgi:hypothetical protein
MTSYVRSQPTIGQSLAGARAHGEQDPEAKFQVFGESVDYCTLEALSV